MWIVGIVGAQRACGGSKGGKNQSGLTESHIQVLGKMLVPTDKVEKLGEGTGLRTNTRDRWKDTQPLSATGSVPAGERIHRDGSSAKA